MITSAKTYTKKKQNKKRIDRTVGQMVKAKLLDKITHRSIHIHTHKKRKREKIYIYCCSQSPPPQFGMIHCLFRYSTNAGYIKLIMEI